MQSSQQETLVHIISILNITRYAAQVNRHSINILMDAAKATSHDINNLYNFATSLTTSISFHQLILHIRSVFANLHDFTQLHLNSFCTYHGLYRCSHIRNTLSTCHTSHGSTKDAVTHSRYSDHLCYTYLFHQMIPYIFYRYLHTHVLIENSFYC